MIDMSEEGKKVKKKKMGRRGQTILVFSVLMAVVFMQTTLLFAVSMLPTAVSSLVDRTGRGTLVITVGAMNLAGCSPFMFNLWLKGHTLELALDTIADPKALAVIYASAAMGYLLNWGVSGVVESIMTRQGQMRLKEIKRRQKELVDVWGEEVTGEVRLDMYGFAVKDGQSE